MTCFFSLSESPGAPALPIPRLETCCVDSFGAAKGSTCSVFLLVVVGLLTALAAAAACMADIASIVVVQVFFISYTREDQLRVYTG